MSARKKRRKQKEKGEKMKRQKQTEEITRRERKIANWVPNWLSMNIEALWNFKRALTGSGAGKIDWKSPRLFL
jgi:hypothetical protein